MIFIRLRRSIDPKRAIQLFVSLALSALFVWLSFRGAPLAEVFDAIRRVDPTRVMLYVLVWSAIHVVRIHRWGRLLAPLVKVRFRDVHPIGAVGFMALMVMPLRLGEFARPILASERLGVRKSAAFASVVVERVVDGVFTGFGVVVLLWGLTGVVPEERVAPLRLAGVFISVGFGTALVLLFLAYRFRAQAVRILNAVLGRVSPKLAEKVTGMLEAFFTGLDIFPSWKPAAEFLALTSVYWALCALGIWVLAPAFGIHLGAWEVSTVLGLQVIGAMIPAGPGMIGTLQYFTVVGLHLFVGQEMRAETAAFAHSIWAIQALHQVVTGMFFVLTGHVPLGRLLLRLSRGETAPEPAAPPAAS